MGFSFTETSEHEPNHGQINHAFSRLRLPLVVAVETAVTAPPAEGAFHHPAARQHTKGMRVGSFDYLDGAAPQLLRPLDQRPRVATVGPDMPDSSARSLTGT